MSEEKQKGKVIEQAPTHDGITETQLSEAPTEEVAQAQTADSEKKQIKATRILGVELNAWSLLSAFVILGGILLGAVLFYRSRPAEIVPKTPALAVELFLKQVSQKDEAGFVQLLDHRANQEESKKIFGELAGLPETDWMQRHFAVLTAQDGRMFLLAINELPELGEYRIQSVRELPTSVRSLFMEKAPASVDEAFEKELEKAQRWGDASSEKSNESKLTETDAQSAQGAKTTKSLDSKTQTVQTQAPSEATTTEKTSEATSTTKEK